MAAAIAVCLFLELGPRTQAEDEPVAEDAAATARLTEIRQKLRYLGQALANRDELLFTLAPADVRLSWRVHLLPFIGEPELYEQFHFDEPWNSEHNLTLLDQMPDVYRIGEGDDHETPFQVFAGEGMLFGEEAPRRMRDIRDGAAHTILIAVTGLNRAVPWTSPADLSLNPVDPLLAFGELPDAVFHCVFADRSLLSVPARLDPSVLTTLATPAGGEIVDVDALRRNDVAAAMLPVVKPRSEAAAAAQLGELRRRMHRIGLAMHNYHDVFQSFPVAGSDDRFDKDGRPKLSWRVHVLPFLDQKPLYDQFHLNEPWDSPHNRGLLTQMPEVFRAPDDDPDTNTSRIVTLNGGQALFGGAKPPRIRDIRDGLSNTILFVQVGSDRSVPWTKPVDADFLPDDPRKCLGAINDSPIVFCMVDGSIWAVKPELPDQLFGALVTPNRSDAFDRKEIQFLKLP